MDIKVFISYRRTDSKTFAGRIYDRMAQHFGKDYVFKDVDDIPAGYDFREVLNESVNNSDVLLALIGSGWLEQKGVRRIDSPTDFVRIEIEAGLKRKDTLVIPVLIDGTHMPAPDDLPNTLKTLAFRNAAIVRDDPDFHNDMNRLIKQITKHFGIEEQASELDKEEPISTPDPETATRSKQLKNITENVKASPIAGEVEQETQSPYSRMGRFLSFAIGLFITFVSAMNASIVLINPASFSLTIHEARPVFFLSLFIMAFGLLLIFVAVKNYSIFRPISRVFRFISQLFRRN